MRFRDLDVKIYPAILTLWDLFVDNHSNYPENLYLWIISNRVDLNEGFKGSRIRVKCLKIIKS